MRIARGAQGAGGGPAFGGRIVELGTGEKAAAGPPGDEDLAVVQAGGGVVTACGGEGAGGGPVGPGYGPDLSGGFPGGPGGCPGVPGGGLIVLAQISLVLEIVLVVQVWRSRGSLNH